jgi:hypothetical protein
MSDEERDRVNELELDLEVSEREVRKFKAKYRALCTRVEHILMVHPEGDISDQLRAALRETGTHGSVEQELNRASRK